MKKCLIVVDYQIDFVSGALGFEKAVLLDEKIAEKIDMNHQNNDEVIFTFDTHKADYLNTQEGKNLPIEHCIENTEGHKLYGKTATMQQPEDKCFYKPSCGSSELFEYLKNRGYETIELCGVVSNICVISNAILAKTAQPETEIIIDSNAIASNDDKLNNCAIEVMKSLQIKVV